MRKIIFLSFAFIVAIDAHLYAQDTLSSKCWTPEMDTTEFRNQPWYSNNDYLENFLDSIGYPSGSQQYRIIGAPEVRFWIPIKFWIYRNDNGTGGPSLPQVQSLIDDLNLRYNQTNNAMIGFYMKCDPTYINKSSDVTKTFTGASILMATNNDPGSFNVHIIGNFASSGTAGFSIPFLNASMIPSGSYLNSTANGDLAHEIGHLLGLSHTHQYSALDFKCLTECVSRTRTWPTLNLCPTRLISNRVCEATGDGLRDTQADDNLLHNNSCNYNVNFGNDPWGDSYDNPPAGLQDRPDVHNIMSYNSATNCVDQFSRLQIGVMLWTLYFKKPNNFSGWANPISTFDNYEPDNDAITARNIQLNEIQERNFHQQWNRVGPLGYTTQCDVDWVRFTPLCTQTYDIQTSAMTGRTNANTRLTVFNSALTQLAQNDDISTSNPYSKITLSLTASQTYFIRIENMSANVTGYYNLNVTQAFAINGDDNFCTTSSNYTIPNLPTGATVQWNVTPSSIATPGTPNATQTTLTKNSNGIITLTATISNICNGQTTVTKNNIVVGALPPTYITGMANGKQFAKNCTYDFTSSGTSWNVGGGTIISGQGTNTITVKTGGVTPYFNVGVRQINTCGTSDYFTLTGSVVNAGCAQIVQARLSATDDSSKMVTNNKTDIQKSFVIYPNPAKDELMVTSPSFSINEWVSIYNANGELIHREKINSTQQMLNISSFKAGLYLLKIDINGEIKKVSKIIKL